ncbi:hypothetical protein MVEN_01231500 [Mycena venus]|uniref:F-box domain-containing protein n=1 Tax=Mycena venus TaxID=2733690 RepID=A0A8H6Y6B8_9AGAR|nr:hypothetical protein MVEN_01231500 [Mycena venus]
MSIELPMELEREIFELAFEANDRDLSLKQTLCLVSRRVQSWIDRIFYELVSLATDRRARKFLTLIQSNSKPTGFFAASVKYLCLGYSVNSGTACGILAACSQIQSLAYWVGNNSPELPLLVSRLPLRRLSTEVDHFSRIPLSRSTWLSNLTHLELVAWSNFSASKLVGLAHLPCLTHVCLNSEFMVAEHVAMVCSSCPRLQVLIPLNASLSPPIPQSARDRRIVVQTRAREVQAIREWEASYFSRPSVWSRAEATMKERSTSSGQQ